MRPAPTHRLIALIGALVSLLMILMKVVPVIPGHFTRYEWLTLAIWSLLGATLRRRQKAQEISTGVGI